MNPVVRIRFVSHRDLASRIIKGAQVGFWATHTEAVMPDGTYLGSRWEGGVQARPADYDAGVMDREQIVDVPCVTQAQADVFHAYLTSMVGTPYDCAAIMEMAEGAVFGKEEEWDEGKSIICSALMQSALIRCGRVFSAPASIRLTMPVHVFYAVSSFVNTDPSLLSPPGKA